MAKQRSTFGKIQREQEKRAKQQAKRDKRAQKGSEGDGEVEERQVAADQGAILDALARLYQAYENGEMETEDFELRRDELRAQIDLS
ncbi:MAG TPA: hypothetical protein VM345_09500 [Acidimicrobiales bacterium]|jgi:hypothetical protein|nr:hypothetical protein [Acidimicrobiales bacterium]